jgi:hypothetical protein
MRRESLRLCIALVIAANTIDDYGDQNPPVPFLESSLCHRYTSCPILRPWSKLDIELHMTTIAAPRRAT